MLVEELMQIKVSWITSSAIWEWSYLVHLNIFHLLQEHMTKREHPLGCSLKTCGMIPIRDRRVCLSADAHRLF